MATAMPGLASAVAANHAPTVQRQGHFDMFHIGQRVVCVDDRFPGENGVFDPTFAKRCPNLPMKDRIYTVRGFVVPYAGYPGTPGMLLEEIVNPPCPYYEGTFEPSFLPSHFRPVTDRKTDTSVFTDALRSPKYARSNTHFGLDYSADKAINGLAALDEVASGIETAVRRAPAATGHLVKIEVEVDTLAQLQEALAIGVDAVLLDNMSVEDLHRTVAMVDGRAITEASGRITPASAPAVAATNVDLISAGRLTYSTSALDIGLDYSAEKTINGLAVLDEAPSF
jgi:hypothetical protein